MARDRQGTDLVILAYDPANSARDNQLLRSAALSHAARVSHGRRRRKTQESRPVVRESGITSRNRHAPRHQLALPLSLGYFQHRNRGAFDSMALRIAPDSAHLMSSWADYLQDNPNDSTRWLTTADMHRDFSLSCESELNSISLVYAASSALSARFPHHEGLKATSHRSKRICINRLNSIVKSQAGKSPTTELANCLLLVFIGLCVSNNTTEAKVYASEITKMLRHPELWEKPELIAIWGRLYLEDMLFATRYFRPPLLKSSLFVERWTPVLNDIRMWESRRLPLPSKVTVPAFSKTIGGLLYELQAQIDFLNCGTLDTSEQFNERHRTASLVIILEITYSLFSHQQFSQDEIQEARNGRDRIKWHNELQVTLCLLAFLACMIWGPSTPDRPSLQECGRRAMRALRHNLEQVPVLASSHPDFCAYKHLQVWACYLGSLWELECTLKDDETWYMSQLRLKMRELGVSNWKTLKSIVDRFLMVPATYKRGGVWFLGMGQMDQTANSSDLHQNKSSSTRLANGIFV